MSTDSATASKPPQPLYYARVVREALAKRPGQGARTDRSSTE
jgi:hypothetical protein